jgi:predicted DNA binding CopG/RHH family protein
MQPVERVEDIPTFASEDDEHQYWATHSLGDAILSEMEPVEDEDFPAPRPRTRPVPIRLGEDIIARAKVLAARRHTGYQTLIKEFIVERLYEEEKRAGLR